LSYEKLNTYKQIVEEMFESVGQTIGGPALHAKPFGLCRNGW